MDIAGLPDKSRVLAVPYGTNEELEVLRGRSLATKLRHALLPEEAHPPGAFHRMLRSLPELVENIHFDAVWATSPSLWPLRVARDIAKRRGLPWVADLRDIPWQAAGIGGSFRSRFLRFRQSRRLCQILRSASAVVTVSDHLAGVLGAAVGRKVDVIQNGFDPEMFKKNRQAPASQFRITYMGRILSSWYQEPRPLFEALDHLVGRSELDPSLMEVKFYGTEPELLRELLSGYRCRSIVSAEQRVSYGSVPVIMNRSCVLLLLTNRGRNGILTTKAFEYLGARRPILCVPGDGGELDALLSCTNAGVSCPTAESIMGQLRSWYREWRETGIVSYHGREGVIVKYSRKQQAAGLAAVLNGVLERKPTRATSSCRPDVATKGS